jgi:hypothetical protein
MYTFHWNNVQKNQRNPGPRRHERRINAGSGSSNFEEGYVMQMRRVVRSCAADSQTLGGGLVVSTAYVLPKIGESGSLSTLKSLPRRLHHVICPRGREFRISRSGSTGILSGLVVQESRRELDCVYREGEPGSLTERKSILGSLLKIWAGDFRGSRWLSLK